MTKARKGLIAIAVLAAAYGGATWYVGFKAESEIQRQVAHLNGRVSQALEEGAEATISIVDYQRHWFSSHIEYEVRVSDEGEQQTIRFADELSHGPFPLAAVLKGHLAPLLAYSELQLLPSASVQPWFEATQGQPPIMVQNSMAFDGAVQGTVNVAPANYRTEGLGEPAEVDFAGAQLSYQLLEPKNSEVFSTKLSYKMGEMRVDGHPIGQMELNLDLQRWDHEVLALLSNSERVDAMTEEQLQPYLVQLLKHQPELTLMPLSWKNAAGTSYVKSEVLFAATAADAATSDEVDLAQLFERLNVEVQLSRPMLQGLFAQDSFMSSLADMLFVQMAKQWEQAGLVVYDGSQVSLHLRYEPDSNELLLNNQPIEPEDLLYAWLLIQMMGLQ